jgi:hypothetical protein
VNVFEVGNIEGHPGRAEIDRSNHRLDVSQDFGGAVVAQSSVRLIGGTRKSLMRQVDALDPRGGDAF